MAGKIGVTPEFMEEKSRRYAQESAVVNEVLGKLDGLLMELQSEWEGQASSAYAQRYTELKPHIESTRDLLDEISISLKKVADQFRATDDAVAAAFRG